MIVVDSSVWIDYFGGVRTVHTDWLHGKLEPVGVLVGDLVLIEVLQGCRDDRDFARLHAILTLRPVLQIVDAEIAVAAARNYRVLRGKGITVRKTVDTLIATRCIHDSLPLLYRDRDFDHFVEHLGLIPALDAASGAS